MIAIDMGSVYYNICFSKIPLFYYLKRKVVTILERDTAKSTVYFYL